MMISNNSELSNNISHLSKKHSITRYLQSNNDIDSLAVNIERMEYYLNFSSLQH